MALTLGERGLKIVVDLDDSAAKKAWERQEKMATALGNKLKTAFAAAAVATGGLVVASAKVGIAFDSSMSRLAANVGATGQQYDQLKKASIAAMETTIFGANQSADALYNLTSAGLSVEQAIGTLGPTLQMAQAENYGLAESATLMTNTLGQFEMSIGEADRISNALVATVVAANMEMPHLSEALKMVGGQAHITGLGFEETLAALSAFSTFGYKGSQAGTTFAAALRELRDTGGKLGPYMKDVNIASDGLAVTLDKLKANGLTAQEALTLLGAEGGNAVALLMQAGGDAIRDYTDKVTDTTFAADKAAVSFDNMEGDLLKLQNTAGLAGITMWDAMKPALREAVQLLTDKVKELAGWFDKNKDSIAKMVEKITTGLVQAFSWLIENSRILITVLGGLVTTFVALKIGALVQQFIGFVGVLKTAKTATQLFNLAWKANPLGIVATAIGLATTAIGYFTTGVKENKEAVVEATTALDDYRTKLEDITSVTGLTAEVESLTTAVRERQKIIDGMLGKYDEWRSAGKTVIEQVALATSTGLNDQINKETELLQLDKDRLKLAIARLALVKPKGDAGASNPATDPKVTHNKAVLKLMTSDNVSWFASDLSAREAWLGESNKITIDKVEEVKVATKDLVAVYDEAYSEIESRDRFFHDSMFSAAQTAGQMMIGGEKKWGNIRKALQHQLLSSMLSKLLSTMSAEMIAKVSHEAGMKAVTIASEQAKSFAAAGGASLRTAVRAKEATASGANTAKQTVETASGVTAFFARLGPVGLVAAAAAIGMFVAMIRNAARRAGGGLLGGVGGEREDRNLMLYSPGEYVVQASSVRGVGVGTLNHINRTGTLPGGGGGGIVVNVDARSEVTKEAIRRYFTTQDGARFFRELMERESVLSAG